MNFIELIINALLLPTATLLRLETRVRPKTKENLYSPAPESANIDSLLSKSSNLRQVTLPAYYFILHTSLI